jgi:hypothetical protein
MHQQLWGVQSRRGIICGGTRTKKVEYHCTRWQLCLTFTSGDPLGDICASHSRLGVKLPVRTTDQSQPFIAEVTNAWGYTSTPTIAYKVWSFTKHKTKFTFTTLIPVPTLRRSVHSGENILMPILRKCFWTATQCKTHNKLFINNTANA